MSADSNNCIKLDHHSSATAAAIYEIMQVAYQVEADLLRVNDFFPLQRTVERIQSAPGSFYGCHVAGKLAAVIEIESVSVTVIDICSLIVNPCFFRAGLASRLLHSVFALFPMQSFTVSTGIKNIPALALYRKLGFIDTSLWETRCGIRMISLTRPCGRSNNNLA